VWVSTLWHAWFWVLIYWGLLGTVGAVIWSLHISMAVSRIGMPEIFGSEWVFNVGSLVDGYPNLVLVPIHARHSIS
jgi:hypothetical protein